MRLSLPRSKFACEQTSAQTSNALVPPEILWWCGWLAILLCGNACHGQPFIGQPLIDSSARRSELPGTLADESNSTGRLTWTNSHAIPGLLTSADAGHFTWNTSLFREPVVVDVDSISSLTFPPGNRRDKTNEPFQFAIHGGDILFGHLRGMDKTTVKIESQRTGLVRIKREFINRIQRMNNPALVYLGPNGIAGWETIRVLRHREEWASPDGKILETIKRNAELFRPLKLSEQTEFEITLETTNTFGFLISLDDDPGSSIGVETWGDELVIVSGDDYEPLMTIAKGTQSLTARLLIDRKKKTLSVYAETGKLLGSLQGHVPEAARPGIYLRNKSRHLRLKSLRVNKSTRPPPRGVTNRNHRIRLIDGSAIYGQVERFDPATSKIILAPVAATGPEKPSEKTNTAGAARSVSLKDIDSLTLGVEPPANPTTGAIQTHFADGGRISGTMHHIRDNTLTVTTSYALTPVSAQLVHATQINHVGPQTVTTEDGDSRLRDTLESAAGKIPGKVLLDGPESDAIRWEFPGGKASVAISPQARAVIVRNTVTSMSPVDRDKYHDQVFLKNLDSLPCKIQSIDDAFIYLTTPLADVDRIPLEHLKAVEFAVTGQIKRQGFGDDGWKVLSINTEAVRATDAKIEFVKPAAFGHMGAMNGDRISFDLDWPSNGSTDVKLMLMATHDQRLQAPTNLQIRCKGESVTVGSVVGITELFNLSSRRQVVRCPGSRAHIEIHRRKQYLRVEVNGLLVYSMSISKLAASDAGGLVVSVTGEGFASAVRAAGSDDIKPQLTLSNFLVWQIRSQETHSRIRGAIKTQTLTIPRSRRKNPSTNVLIANNGDLLRGRLASADTQQISFYSRLENFQFERNRIAAIVWLHPKIDQETSALDSAATELLPDFATNAVNAVKLSVQSGLSAAENLATESTGVTTQNSKPTQVSAPSAADEQPSVRVAYSNGINVTVKVAEVRKGYLVGESKVLGRCRLPLDGASELHFGGYGKLVAAMAYSDWQSSPAKPPEFVSGANGGVIVSAATLLTGTKAIAVEAKLLDGSEFRLEDHLGKVVILDFWATWCVPCVRAMPAYLEALKGLDPDQVVFIAVNQDEPAAAIKEFLKLRKWDVRIALDPGAEIGRGFKVESIPQTVVIRPDGKIESVHTGYRRGAADELRATVNRLLSEFPTD